MYVGLISQVFLQMVKDGVIGLAMLHDDLVIWRSTSGLIWSLVLLQMVKYGVIDLAMLHDDLLTWRSMYVSGRLQKPTLQLMDSPRIQVPLAENLRCAAAAALLLLPQAFSMGVCLMSWIPSRGCDTLMYKQIEVGGSRCSASAPAGILHWGMRDVLDSF
jgi:hypothetical protein